MPSDLTRWRELRAMKTTAITVALALLFPLASFAQDKSKLGELEARFQKRMAGATLRGAYTQTGSDRAAQQDA